MRAAVSVRICSKVPFTLTFTPGDLRKRRKVTGLEILHALI